MKRRNALSVGEIVEQFLKQEKIDSEYDQQRALLLWPEIVGPGINRYTTSRTISNGVMTITLCSASLRNELMFNRELLVKRINEALGRDVVKDIILR